MVASVQSRDGTRRVFTDHVDIHCTKREGVNVSCTVVVFRITDPLGDNNNEIK